MLRLLKNLTIEGQKTQLLPLHATAQLKAATEAAIIDRRGCGCWVRVRYGIEVREEPA